MQTPGGVAAFQRFSDGTLIQPSGLAGGCISSDGFSGGTANQCINSGNSALANSWAAAVDPQSKHVYVSGQNGMTAYSRNTTTGILTQVEIPVGYAGFVQPRSGLAARHGIGVVNSPGLIDSGYRGEIRVVLLNTDKSEPFTVEPGMRIAQLVVAPVASVRLVEVDELATSERGAHGFGSSAR